MIFFAFRQKEPGKISIGQGPMEIFFLYFYVMVELASLIILGILAQWIAWYTRLPAILPLILIGLAVGPVSSLFTADGSKWMEPVYDPVRGHGLFPNEYLFYFVELSIGIILFEGGLTLKMKEIREVGPTIWKLITVGAAITFVGGALGVHFLMGLNWQLSALFAALIIVTGPTVIAPILRNLPLKPKVATVLKWEGILIDPLGALVAVLVFDFIISGQGGAFTLHAFESFVRILIVGASLGFTAAHFLRSMLKHSLIPHYLINVFTLALVLGVFVASDQLEHESGLLSVVVMGMVLGNMDNTKELNYILDFKESLSILLISMLFILLSANIDIEQILLLKDYRVLWLFLFVVFLLRPLAVFISTHGSSLSYREKAFISWVGPRGVVAAGVASLFGMKLMGEVEGAEYITPLVFMIVAGTVLINATTARLIAGWLGVAREGREGILIIGANKAARLIAKYLQNAGKEVILLDRSATLVEKARAEGLTAIQEDVFSDNLRDHPELLNIKTVLAMTASSDVNKFAVEKFRNWLEDEGVAYRLISQDELIAQAEGKASVPKEGLFSCVDDYLNLSEAVRDYPYLHEIPLASKEDFEKVIARINRREESVPLFIKRKTGDQIDIILSRCEDMEVQPGDVLVYIGKEIPPEERAGESASSKEKEENHE